MERLFRLDGEKLPGESVWVDAQGMYEVYGRITVDVDKAGPTEFIITDIVNEGLIVTVLN
jgi:hypothetical protein